MVTVAKATLGEGYDCQKHSSCGPAGALTEVEESAWYTFLHIALMSFCCINLWVDSTWLHLWTCWSFEKGQCCYNTGLSHTRLAWFLLCQPPLTANDIYQSSWPNTGHDSRENSDRAWKGGSVRCICCSCRETTTQWLTAIFTPVPRISCLLLTSFGTRHACQEHIYMQTEHSYWSESCIPKTSPDPCLKGMNVQPLYLWLPAVGKLSDEQAPSFFMWPLIVNISAPALWEELVTGQLELEMRGLCVSQLLGSGDPPQHCWARTEAELFGLSKKQSTYREQEVVFLFIVFKEVEIVTKGDSLSHEMAWRSP